MDIVEQLRKSANTVYSQDGYTFRLGLHNEAANEIEKLRKALRYILTHCESDSPPNAKALILFVNNALKEGE